MPPKFGDSRFEAELPKFNFGDKPHPQQPTYSDLSCWSVHPDQPQRDVSANHIVPLDEGEVLAQLDSRPCDCFWVTGTYAFSPDSWNGPVPGHDAKPPFWCNSEHTLAQEVDDDIIEAAAAFNNRCRVWAPYYRCNPPPCHNNLMHPSQSKEWQRAAYGSMDLAYSDVERAFEHFVEEVTRRHGNSPFIIASHSQGSMHATRLLERLEDNKELRSRLVCAYILGPCGTFTVEKFQRCFPSLSPCRGPLDLNCVVAFDNCAEGCPDLKGVKGGELVEADIFPIRNCATPDYVPHNVRYKDGKWECASGKAIFCTNPLTWKSWVGEAGETAEKGPTREELAAVYKGSLKRNMDDKGNVVSISKEVHTVGKVWAEVRLDGGVLVSTELEGDTCSWHGEPLKFWFNIRENVAARVDHYLKERS